MISESELIVARYEGLGNELLIAFALFMLAHIVLVSMIIASKNNKMALSGGLFLIALFLFYAPLKLYGTLTGVVSAEFGFVIMIVYIVGIGLLISKNLHSESR